MPARNRMARVAAAEAAIERVAPETARAITTDQLDAWRDLLAEHSDGHVALLDALLATTPTCAPRTAATARDALLAHGADGWRHLTDRDLAEADVLLAVAVDEPDPVGQALTLDAGEAARARWAAAVLADDDERAAQLAADLPSGSEPAWLARGLRRGTRAEAYREALAAGDTQRAEDIAAARERILDRDPDAGWRARLALRAYLEAVAAGDVDLAAQLRDDVPGIL